MYSLRMSAWIVPDRCSGETGRRRRAALGGGDVEGEHDRGGRVDRHRDGHVAEVDAGEQRLHVVERVDGDALAPDLAERASVVGVVAHQRGHVERGREAGLPVVEQVVEALVGLLAGAEAGELAHRPQPPAVHRGVDAARVGVGAGAARSGPRAAGADAGGQVGGRVQLADGLARERAEARIALARRSAAAGLAADCHGRTSMLPVALASASVMRGELSRTVGAEHVLEAPPRRPYNSDASRRRGVRAGGRRGAARQRRGPRAAHDDFDLGGLRTRCDPRQPATVFRLIATVGAPCCWSPPRCVSPGSCDAHRKSRSSAPCQTRPPRRPRWSPDDPDRIPEEQHDPHRSPEAGGRRRGGRLRRLRIGPASPYPVARYEQRGADGDLPRR